MPRSAVLVLVTVIVSQLFSQEIPRFEAGVILGEPIGLSAKLWLDRRSAIDAAVAWSFVDEGRFEIHGDYLFHFLYPDIPGELPVYFGLGAAVYIRDESFVGARLPIGVSYLFENAPLSAFLEAAPLVEFHPGAEFGFSGGIGLRLAF